MGKSKKIIPIVALVIIAILVITTIVMACVPKSYAPTNVLSTNAQPSRIVLGESNKVYMKNDENTKAVYNDLYNKYLDSFQESSINSLFNGRIGLNAETRYNETSTKLSSLSTDYIMLVFDNSLKVKVEDSEYSFDKIVIELESTNVMKTVKAYLFNESTYNEGTNYYLSTIGNLEGLVNYTNNLD